VLSREGGVREDPVAPVFLHRPRWLINCSWVQCWSSVLNSERDKNSLFCPTGKAIREFSPDVRANLGNDLHRPEDGLEPLDSGSMGATLPHVHEIRNQDTERWCRVLYI
jgi:hypothetical protein